MKTSKIGRITLLPMLTLFIIALLSSILTIKASAKNLYTMNLYNGVKYETEEELKELEKILRADKYICVSSWCSDDPTATEKLKADDNLFSCKDFLDYKDFKVFISPTSLESCLNGGFDNMDSVIINGYAYSEEAQNEGGDIVYNYTQNPKNITAGTEGTGTLTIDSIINEEIAEKYRMSSAIFIFTSKDHGKSYEIDLSGANGFKGVYTIVNGNYEVTSIFLNEEVIPTCDITDFTIADGIGATLTFDFVGNSKGNEATEEVTEKNDKPIDYELPEDIVEEAPKTVNIVPIIVTVGCILIVGIAGLVIFLVLKKKFSNTSV